MKILYLAIGMASPLSMSLEMCRRLRDAGHTVTYASHEDLGDRVRAHGHDFVRLEDPEPAPPIRPMRPLKSFLEQRRRRRRSIDDDAPVRLLDAVRPDRIVADLEMHVAILKLAGPARRRGIPLLLTLLFFPVHTAPGRPPLHVADLPAEDPRGRLRLRLMWIRTWLERLHFEWKVRLGRWRRLVPRPSVGYFCFDIDDLRDVARRHGFDLRRETTRRHWLRPFMYTRLPVLCWNARELDWPQGSSPEELPENVSYVGPMVFRGAADGPQADAWRQFRAERDAGRPLIYASLGSFWAGDTTLLRHLVEIFARRLEWDLVLGLGRQADAAVLGQTPPNVLVLDWAPQTEVLTDADAAVVHGGVATLNECAVLGVPTVVYSTGFVEQDGNAARVDFHGIGRVAATPKDIEPSIHSVLEDPSFRRRLDALRPALARYAQERVALGLIDSQR